MAWIRKLCKEILSKSRSEQWNYLSKLYLQNLIVVAEYVHYFDEILS